MTIRKIAKKILPKPLRTIIKQVFPAERRIIKNPNLDKLRKTYNNAWKDDSIPYKQLELTKKELVDFTKVAPMKAIVDLMKKIKIKKPSVLEIGCSTGYYSEVFKRAGLNVEYEGCDYSPTFIKLAKKRYPSIKFKVTDATKLDYNDTQFDIAISGCCILHIVDYQKAIAETVRVSKQYILFHRTPVIHNRQTTYSLKTGYGTKMLEIFFNEKGLINLFCKNNLIVKSVNTYAQFHVRRLGEPVFMKSYLCKKI